MEGASSDTIPRNTNTHNHFVTTPVGLIKFKQVVKKKKSCHPNRLLQPTHIKIKEAKEEKKKAYSPCDYSLKLGIIRSQTWFTPCSSLIVLKSSVTRRRRRRRMPASKHTYMCRRERTHTITIGLDGE